ncbi:MAG: bifunctional phosphopantothenoylcysteine decarboxylase/phosphopantothenate--cysteine ligase CoaBC [Chloroflexota bacterium]
MTVEPISVMQDKHIVLGVTGSIACYKAVDLASKLTQSGALVDVILTEAAARFVSSLTFQAVTGRPVYTSMWATDSGSDALPTHIAHVGLGEDADLLAVIPATAHTLARLAQGMADDLLGVTALAARGPLLVAPAMDGGMYIHPVVQANLKALRDRGVFIIEPEEGRFASGLTGRGRLPETPTLIGHIRRVMGRAGDLEGQKVVVSAGGTREAIDPVRYIGNRSSGKQGHAIAQAVLDAGAREVVLVTTAELPEPVGAVRVQVESAQEMRDAVIAHSTDADLLVMAAAVADFRPAMAARQKIKKESAGTPTVELAHTPDILMDVRAAREESGFPRVVIGFAAESENLLKNARDKLKRKGLDLLVANDILAEDAGFSVDTNRVIILDTDGDATPLDLTSKTRVAEAIIARAALLLRD